LESGFGNKSLEAMDEMFNLPWYIIGRKGATMTAGRGSTAEAYDDGDLEKNANTERAEHEEHGKQRENEI
jgi:hypothetical protein